MTQHTVLITCELILKSCTVLVVVDKIFIVIIYYPFVHKIKKKRLKETKSATMNVFRKKNLFFLNHL